MKKIYFLLSVLAFSLASCSGDEGPVGPPGPQGPQGPAGVDGLIGTVFDIQGDFTAENDYTLFAEYSQFTDVEVFETDVVLVYLRVGQDGEAGGEPVWVWRLLPQTYYLEGGGTMQYNYDYTFFDVNIFLDANVDLSTLGAAFTDDQVFRVAIVPADIAQNANLDFTDYQEVMSAMNYSSQEVPSLDLD